MPPARGANIYGPPPGRHSAIGMRRPPGRPASAPPRVGQVSFASSLDTNRNILTDNIKAAIVNYRRKEPRPAL